MHEHELTKTRCAYEDGRYKCDICFKDGQGWVYVCSDCSFDAHLLCAWNNNNNDDDNDNYKKNTEPFNQNNIDDGQMNTEGRNDTINILLSNTGINNA